MRIQIMSHITENTMYLHYEQHSVNVVYSERCSVYWYYSKC